jgi:hypothetical protein
VPDVLGPTEARGRSSGGPGLLVAERAVLRQGIGCRGRSFAPLGRSSYRGIASARGRPGSLLPTRPEPLRGPGPCRELDEVAAIASHTLLFSMQLDPRRRRAAPRGALLPSPEGSGVAAAPDHAADCSHGRRMKVIHECAGLCKWAVKVLGWWGSGPLRVVAAGCGAFQSSIRPWVGQGVVRGSGAQSRRRPSGWWRPDIGTSSPERAQAGPGRGRKQVRGELGHVAMAFIALARSGVVRQRISPSRRP